MALSSLWKRKLLMYVIDNGPRGEIGNGSSLMARTEGMSRAGIIERPWVACQVILRGWLNECVAVKAGGDMRNRMCMSLTACHFLCKDNKDDKMCVWIVAFCVLFCSDCLCVTLWTNNACVLLCFSCHKTKRVSDGPQVYPIHSDTCHPGLPLPAVLQTQKASS